jgi:hypothetical protein
MGSIPQEVFIDARSINTIPQTGDMARLVFGLAGNGREMRWAIS